MKVEACDECYENEKGRYFKRETNSSISARFNILIDSSVSP